MTAALSDAYSVEVVDAVRGLTAGVTDTPTLPSDRWEALVRRAAEADSEIARVVARVDRRISLQGLARRFAGEAARADQHPGLREVVDRLVAGNGRQPSNDEIDNAVDAAAAWSYRSRQRSQVIQVAADQLPARLGIVELGWASQAGCPKRSDGVALVPVEAFARWCRHAATAGDVDALVQMARADGVALDLGKYSSEHVPVATNSPAVNTARALTWVLPPHDHGSSRSRANLILRAPQWRAALDDCPAVAKTFQQIASGSTLAYA